MRAWRIEKRKRRVGEGKKDVRVYKINIWRSDERREYRNIRLLAEKARL